MNMVDMSSKVDFIHTYIYRVVFSNSPSRGDKGRVEILIVFPHRLIMRSFRKSSVFLYADSRAMRLFLSVTLCSQHPPNFMLTRAT